MRSEAGEFLATLCTLTASSIDRALHDLPLRADPVDEKIPVILRTYHEVSILAYNSRLTRIVPKGAGRSEVVSALLDLVTRFEMGADARELKAA